MFKSLSVKNSGKTHTNIVVSTLLYKNRSGSTDVIRLLLKNLKLNLSAQGTYQHNRKLGHVVKQACRNACELILVKRPKVLRKKQREGLLHLEHFRMSIKLAGIQKSEIVVYKHPV
jgi:hypothetical protein